MIRVLVIDDSAVMRAFLGRVVSSQRDMELLAASPDPLLAMERIRRNPPDVITLDVEMPRMNGLDFLRQLMAARPLPVVMISSLTREGAETTLRALELGAVDFFPKPANFDGLEATAQEIAEKIRAAAGARIVRRRPIAVTAPAPKEASLPPAAQPAAPAGGQRVIGIGASTGGVEALRDLLTALPPHMPPILIAQHMPPGFTETFARRLDTLCRMHVKQAEDSEVVRTGVAYIAPGGRHLVLSRRGSGYQLRVTEDPPVNRHRPSVDTLLRSVARAAGQRAIGVMLTGMGGDGAEAMLEMSQSGAFTIAQDEASCVVFGMPRQAIAAGGVREVLPLSAIAGRLEALALPAA
ncbi:chemotaxis response regulator protein-glutamate methylesterase [Ramlibacter ginsenosidimutans]|uniref:Protein-glutamate methylesterase/protein-glutamine glutaminase n=1 Tax=Ramlibacter ginsenosidimutans TaxID=502333 RepID=A0A934TVN1_9BURK|nr:chemotaxis response regulator protein-glutamate methylesterase [Ramlibacter ginsenosidimutans]MBK6008336.1 chemotaxis response regulator protein-glutamate methylesterase [Ramlibacter ginsenosidimutans]